MDNLQRQTGHSVHFAVRSGTVAVYLAKVEGRQPYQMASKVGMQVALHCTAIGKALLAEFQEEVRAVIAATSPPIRHTAATIVEPDRLIEELAAVRERGYAIDDEENERDVRRVGAVVRDRHGTPIGAVSVSALTFTLDSDDAGVLGPLVVAAADRISTALGLTGRGA
jgi:IclR family acetate operon transcriptional repressor